MQNDMITEILATLSKGQLIPYFGPGVNTLEGVAGKIPAAPEQLVDHLTAKSSVPGKIRKNLTAAAQFIENFKHRKTVQTAMTAAFSVDAGESALHRWVLTQPNLPLVVHAWYDSVPQSVLKGRDNWGMVQAVSQAEYFGTWCHYFDSEGKKLDIEPGNANFATLLYQPIGSVWPAQNYLVSDSDYVEVLTEIDIQTPIPVEVQTIRKDRNFLFLGCRFNTQLERSFARQVMKRSSDKHWAILPGELTKNELRFLEEQKITRVDMTLEQFVEQVMEVVPA